MKCGNCGAENLDTNRLCDRCQEILPQSESKGVHQLPGLSPAHRQCPECGRSIPQNAAICPYCYDNSGGGYLPSHPVEAIGTGMRILLYVISILVPLAGIIIGIIFVMKDDPESRHVGKICLILGVVIGILLPIILAAVLYAMVLGFGDVVDGMTPAVIVVSGIATGNGYRFTFSAPTSAVEWSDVAIQIRDGSSFATWHGITTDDLTSIYPPVTYVEPHPEYLGDLEIYLGVTDLVGNGWMNSGDSITLDLPLGQSFNASTVYTLTLMWEPTGGQMVSYNF